MEYNCQHSTLTKFRCTEKRLTLNQICHEPLQKKIKKKNFNYYKLVDILFTNRSSAISVTINGISTYSPPREKPIAI